MPCIALTPFKHENGHINNNEPFVNRKSKLAWQHAEQSHASDAQAFLGASPPRSKPQRGYIRGPHQAPTSIFLYQISNRKHYQ